MARRFLAPLYLAVCCLFVPSMALGQTEKDGIPQKSDLTLCEKLLAQDEKEREAAASALINRQDILIKSLIAKLVAQGERPDRKFGGSFHRIVTTLGNLRATNAVGYLVDFIDIQLTDEHPAGIVERIRPYYPVAEALVKIGGPDLNDSLFSRMGRDATDEFINVTTWALVQNNSESVVRLLTQKKLDRVKFVLKNIGVTDTNPEKRNLERMMQLLGELEKPLQPHNPTSIKSAPTPTPQ